MPSEIQTSLAAGFSSFRHCFAMSPLKGSGLSSFRVGVYMLSPAEVMLIRIMVRLLSHDATLKWSFAREAPYGAVIVGDFYRKQQISCAVRTCHSGTQNHTLRRRCRPKHVSTLYSCGATSGVAKAAWRTTDPDPACAGYPAYRPKSQQVQAAPLAAQCAAAQRSKPDSHGRAAVKANPDSGGIGTPSVSNRCTPVRALSRAFRALTCSMWNMSATPAPSTGSSSCFLCLHKNPSRRPHADILWPRTH